MALLMKIITIGKLNFGLLEIGNTWHWFLELMDQHQIIFVYGVIVIKMNDGIQVNLGQI